MTDEPHVPAAAEEDPAEDPVVLRVRQALIRALLLDGAARDALALHTPLWGADGLGLDSVDAIELAVELEREFGVRMPDGEDSREIYTSIATIADYLLQAGVPRGARRAPSPDPG